MEGLTIQTRIRLTLADAIGQWTEEYSAPVKQEIKKWAEDLVIRFNHKRQQGEFERRLVSVEIINPEGEVQSVSGHDWKRGQGNHYRCSNCGVTGRRKGREWPPVRDRQFKGRFFVSCDVAREYMPLSARDRTVYRNRILGDERWRRNQRSRW